MGAVVQRGAGIASSHEEQPVVERDGRTQALVATLNRAPVDHVEAPIGRDVLGRLLDGELKARDALSKDDCLLCE